MRPLGHRTRLAGALLLGLLLAGALLAGCGARGSSTPPPTTSVRQVARSTTSHVVVIVEENREYGDVIGNPGAPYLNALARRYGLATRSYGIRHPSLPNYLALTSGSTQGIASDCTGCDVDAPNIATQMEQHGVSWKAYLEDLPRPCFTGSFAGGYAKKHDPFAYYLGVTRDPASCHRRVPYTELARDLRRGTLPTFAWISPNLCDDMHDCAVSRGDRFLAANVPALLRGLGPHGFLVITFDEGTTDAGCCGSAHGGHIATIVAGPDVRRGARDGRPVDHYGVLRTIEDALALPRLAAARDARHGSLATLFVSTPRLRRAG